MALDSRQREFIGYLLSHADVGNENLGALADLRSGLGKKPGEMGRVHKYVAPYLPDKSYNDRWYYLTATLFGLFPEHVRGRSLGAAFSALRDLSESMEARFTALLNAHADDIGDYLRHTVSILKTHQRPLDWFSLFEDLLYWEHQDKNVQLRWARDYYRQNN